MARSLPCVDWLAVVYLSLTGALLLVGWGDGWVYQAGVVLHFGIAVVILTLGTARSLPTPIQQVRETYPIFLILLFYAEVDLYVKLLHDSAGYDVLVRSWDAWLFGGHPHLYLSEWLSGRFWAELFHLFYLSYYFLLIGGFLATWSYWPDRFPRFAFVVTGMFASFMGIFMAFPVAGPLVESGIDIVTDGWFPQLVAWLYVPLRANGIATGAFPSSHVGMSVGIVCLLGLRQWWSRTALWGLVLGIAVSTTYGYFHYAIDAVAGGLTGGLLYLGWTHFYTFVERRLSVSEVDQRAPMQSSSGAGPAAADRKPTSM